MLPLLGENPFRCCDPATGMAVGVGAGLQVGSREVSMNQSLALCCITLSGKTYCPSCFDVARVSFLVQAHCLFLIWRCAGIFFKTL